MNSNTQPNTKQNFLSPNEQQREEDRRKWEANEAQRKAAEAEHYRLALIRLQQEMNLFCDQKEEAPIIGAMNNQFEIKNALKKSCKELIEAVEAVKNENIVLSTKILNTTVDFIKNPNGSIVEYENLANQAKLISSSNGITCKRGPWLAVGMSMLYLLATAAIATVCVLASVPTLGTSFIVGILLNLWLVALLKNREYRPFSCVNVNKDPKNVVAKMDSCKRSAFALFKNGEVKQEVSVKSLQPIPGVSPATKTR